VKIVDIARRSKRSSVFLLAHKPQSVRSVEKRRGLLNTVAISPKSRCWGIFFGGVPRGCLTGGGGAAMTTVAQQRHRQASREEPLAWRPQGGSSGAAQQHRIVQYSKGGMHGTHLHAHVYAQMYSMVYVLL